MVAEHEVSRSHEQPRERPRERPRKKTRKKKRKKEPKLCYVCKKRVASKDAKDYIGAAARRMGLCRKCFRSMFIRISTMRGETSE